MTARPFRQLAPLATALLLATSALTAQAQTEQTAQPQAKPRTQATHPNQAQTVRLLFAEAVKRMVSAFEARAKELYGKPNVQPATPLSSTR